MKLSTVRADNQNMVQLKLNLLPQPTPDWLGTRPSVMQRNRLQMQVMKYYPGDIIMALMFLDRKLSTAMQQHIAPFQLGRLLKDKTEQVVFWGEDHGQQRAKQFITTQLVEMHQLGFTHIGIEWAGSDNWPLFREFNISGQGVERIRELLTAQEIAGMFSFSGTENMEFIHQAHELGFTVIPINITNNMHEYDARLQRTVAITYRDLWMAKNIHWGLQERSRLAASSPAKMAVMVGAGHIDKNLGLPYVLQGEYGYSSISVYYATEGTEVDQPMMLPCNRETYKLITLYAPINGSFSHRTPYPADWIVFVP